MVLMNDVMFMTNNGYNVDVLVFDGFMVRKIKELTPVVLEELQKYIKEKTDYDIVFVEKSMENKIDLTKYPDPVNDENKEVTYYKDK